MEVNEAIAALEAYRKAQGPEQAYCSTCFRAGPMIDDEVIALAVWALRDQTRTPEQEAEVQAMLSRIGRQSAVTL